MRLVQIWSEGSSYRDLQTLVKHIYGERLSTRTFSKIVRAADKYVSRYHSREITNFYDAIFIDGLSVSIKGLPREYLYEFQRKKKKNAVILGILGQRQDGKKMVRELIDYKISQSEDVESYRELLKSLSSRGLKFGVAPTRWHRINIECLKLCL